MKYLSLIAVLFIGTLGFAQTIHVLDATKNQLTSYISSEMDKPIPYWVIDGQVYPLSQAKKMIGEEGKTACATWLMNFSDDKGITKEQIQETLLRNSKSIPLWKKVNDRPIFVDPDTNFALSFICATRDAYGNFIDIDATDFVSMFKGLYQFD